MCPCDAQEVVRAACERLMTMDEASSGFATLCSEPTKGPSYEMSILMPLSGQLTREKTVELVIDALAAEKASSGKC